MKMKILIEMLVSVYRRALLVGGSNPERVPAILERVKSDLSSMLASDLAAV